MPIEMKYVDQAATVIKQRLQDLNQSYAELGEKVGLGQSDIARIANARIQDPSFRVICRVAKLLNMTLDEMAQLFGEAAPTGISKDRRFARLAHVVEDLKPDERELILTVIEGAADAVVRRTQER
jgi:transcriptional regulator with XRE-family HTH domain